MRASVHVKLPNLTADGTDKKAMSQLFNDLTFLLKKKSEKS